MTLEKEAQRKSLVNMLGRKLNPMEHARYLFSRKYRDVYNKIKEIDSDMREIALSSDPGIRESLHEARMAFKNREYPRVIYHAWKILESVDGIFSQVDELEKIRESIMEEFYGEGTKLSDEEIRQMNTALGKKPLAQKPVQMPATANLEFLLYTTAAPSLDLSSAEMIKQAGPIQWFQENIPSYRQMEGALLDRIFRNKMGKQREASKQALRIAEKVYGSIKDVFKQLDTARTDFSSYVTIAKRYKDRFDQQKAELSTLYQSQFADIVPDMSQYNKDKIENKPAQPQPAQPQPAQPQSVQESIPVEYTSIQYGTEKPIQEEPPSSDAVMEQDEEEPPLTMRSEQLVGNAAKQVLQLWKRAKIEAKNGNRGISAALLVMASEICDDNDDAIDAKRLIQAAERVLKDE
jgi:hypothetical protein